ncbi:crossover junction endodeoxyribonuclease RuvC [Candidatus Tisiphia endosymbiont of Nemotelus uliginosus]|uniref:crossover junction endodeoxyribonuclease RuvC n=1 Tax=Candidatus Tisiphia endosymbiont of Nemotelus uliginosus TaxID=3077926 RepID=UPI0035C94184
MIILGIDPSLTALGWGIINSSNTLKYLASGIINTRATEAIHKRLAFITSTLDKVILKYQPTIIGMEETFINKNSVSSLKLGYARGAVMALIGSYNIGFQEFAPNIIKKSVTGYGHAEKNQILQMIKLLLAGSSAVNNFDEADALAVAYCCWVNSPKHKSI